MKYVCIGDIHGYAGKVKRILEMISDQVPDFRLVFLGDYIDRGPDSKGVISLLMSIRKQYPETIFLKGNHEDMFLNLLGYDGHFGNYAVINGAHTTIRSYGGLAHIPLSHIRFLRSLQRFHLCDEYPYIFVHAGLNPHVSIEKQSDEDLFWIREPFIQYDGKWPENRKVIFGHTPNRNGYPLIMENKIGIDTACAYHGPLTAVVLPDESFIQVP